MLEQFSREILLLGEKNVEKLNNSKVAVFGIGGVGSFVIEGLARAGIGNFILVDNDEVDITNINRQIIATHKTIGLPKVEVAKQRILDINPEASVEVFKEFFLPDSKTEILTNDINYVADCIDTLTAKIELVVRCKNMNIPIISAMGTGNKLDPTMFKIADIYETSRCPLAKIMRKELRARNIDSLKVIYSEEEPIKMETQNTIKTSKNSISKKISPGSISFVPSIAGLIMSGEIIKSIISIDK